MQGDSPNQLFKKSWKLFETCSISDAEPDLDRKDNQQSLWDILLHSSHDYWLYTYSRSHEVLGAGDAALDTDNI